VCRSASSLTTSAASSAEDGGHAHQVGRLAQPHFENCFHSELHALPS
jgi:hypothetical protein